MTQRQHEDNQWIEEASEEQLKRMLDFKSMQFQ
jgi:hypothetical protein